MAGHGWWLRRVGAVGHVAAPQKRNGADLAVDPTLAGSWAPRGTWRPGVSMPVPRSSCEHSRSASNRPALAPAPVPSGAEINREDQLPAARRFRDLLVDLDLIAAFALPEGSTKSSAPGRQSGLPTLRPRSFNGLGFGPHQDEPLCFPLPIPPPRGFRHRVEAVPKSLLRRRPFGLCLGRANPRLDDLKVQRATDSGKRAIVHLSTSRPNASGQEWITQRFVAARAAYPRSRPESLWARSRSRSALSLMKPCASCWS